MLERLVSGPPVEGFVLTSDALEDEWVRLDEFEGVQYQRVATQARLEDGQVVQAYVYQLSQREGRVRGARPQPGASAARPLAG